MKQTLVSKTKNPNYHITFDLDWCPDSAVALCLELLDQSGVKATFFTTHHTDMNDEIVRKGHTLGIHPNFLSNSSQGKTPEAVLDFCLTLAPDARVVRTHSLVQSTPLLLKMFKHCPQLEIDMSTFTYRAKHVERCKWTFGGAALQRINYNWEDDAEFENQRFDWTTPCFCGETTIFNFHPIHVLLNSSTSESYYALLEALQGKPLFGASDVLTSQYKNKGTGAFDQLRTILRANAHALSLEAVN